MSLEIRGKSDASLELIGRVLTACAHLSPDAQITIYRQNPVSIRVRVVDQKFKDLDRTERDNLIWKCLSELPDEIQVDITLLVLRTPEELQMSFANYEFDNPIPSRL